MARLLVIEFPGCSSAHALNVNGFTKTHSVISNFRCWFARPPTPVVINNTSSTPGGVGVINKWWWNINGNISFQQTPTPVPANQPAQYPIKLVVTTIDGCISDTTTKVITVRYRPVANFTMSSSLCEYDKISFTNTSSLPAAAQPEYINKWYWQFDNSPVSTTEHPSGYFTPGVHQVSMVAESDYGCKSAATTSSFVIQPQPQIQLNIADSCVFRSTRFEASEFSNNSLKWLWDFGSGLKPAQSIVNKNFSKEGNFMVTLIGESIYGCKDTLIRSFRIYDNKAFAGRDTVVAINEPVQLDAHGDGTTITCGVHRWV
jgi:PKD repeat protein